MASKPSNSQVDQCSIRAIKTILKKIDRVGMNQKREGLLDTPNRVVKSWKELYCGYRKDPGKILERTFQSENYNQMVILKDIELYSMCEHHMLPFVGKAHVAYIPQGRVVGLSKLARLVDCFSRRLQIQERLTMQIAQAIDFHLMPLGVGVLIEAEHLCMRMRGVGKQNSTMVTSHLIGSFQEQTHCKEEFFRLVGGSNA